MFFLWRYCRQLLTSTPNPSPKHRAIFTFSGPIEGTSPRVFGLGKAAASMTVEAAFVLPLFLFFFVNLGSAMEMLRLHGNLQLALWDVGNRMCVYGYAAEQAGDIRQAAGEEKGEVWQELADIALSYTYVKREVVNYAGERYLEESPLSGGAAGLQFWESEIFGPTKRGDADHIASPEGTLEIVMTYQVSPWMQIPAVRPFRMVNRYYGHLWTGYDLHAEAEKDAPESGEQDVVYIAENASVYHETLNCTHLKLTIREVSLEEALNSRNESGGRYRLCSKCGKKPYNGTVFIGREGDFYHYDRECSGLKRTVSTMSRQEAAAKYRPCSRCGGTPRTNGD